jgi:uncharacterized protein YndB with AHSA1/START domain
VSRTVHATFTIEREYAFPIARVFAAWADPQAKAKWFAGPKEWKLKHRDQEFRVGGAEHLSGVWPNGKTTHFDGRYYDIVPNERIVFAYEMHVDATRISVSLSTVEFKPGKDGGTRLVLTEQGAFLDAFDDAAGREKGTHGLLDNLERYLKNNG